MSTPAGRGPLDVLGLLAAGMLLGMGVSLADQRFAAARAGRASTAAQSREPARSPAQLSGRGWRRALAGAWREFNEDRIPAVAGGATFFALLALFPALGVFVSLYGLFAHVEDARRQILAMSGILPEGAISVLGDEMTRLATLPHASLSTTFLASLVFSVWSANAGVKALISGLNVAYEEHERRNFLRLNLISLTFTLGAILFALAATGALVLAPETLARFGFAFDRGLRVLRWPLLFVVMVGGLSLLYRYAPNREHARWRWITPGGVLAAAGWMAMSLGFSIYVGNFGHYDRTYGSLGAVVGFMTWIWLSLIVVLLGAELNAELEQQTCVDTTTGPPQPPGQRGAAVSDRLRRRRPQGPE
jgi:membrane protein